MGLSPAAPNGATDIVLAVDPYSKWVKCAALPNLNSHESTFILHNELICRYGVPTTVRTDKGTEFCGAFDSYCREAGIAHAYINTMHPRSNG